ncbi:putative glyoxaloxidase 3 [Violaceomyces palustris]|uniref:Glyoxaloxidase 3 n=1 Tax=Violaceomyces palustris TaxID=1673888 RepID=A0ACD0NW83_9BASI|nr:putative glyoxaloxidase 3 [Violaceomyces palustris]
MEKLAALAALVSSLPVATAATPGRSEVVGKSQVSAMMLFNSSPGRVVILDKTEGNAAQIDGHPAWGEEFDTVTGVSRLLRVVTNTFCAGGMSMGNGTWGVFGGNENVRANGTSTEPRFSISPPYMDGDGGPAARFYTPCNDGNCDWVEGLRMTRRRWYATVEALGDGTLWIGGGIGYGGYVSTPSDNEASYEFWPPRGADPVPMGFLSSTVPVNLYPLTWLMASGRLFVQAGQEAILWDLSSASVAKYLPSTSGPMKCYPSSAGVAMLPLIPSYNYEQSLLFCGGVQRPLGEWGNASGPYYNILSIPASRICERITPESENPVWQRDDDLEEGRSMGSFVYLPDGKLWFGQGVKKGNAGYSNQGFSQYLGTSLGDEPAFQPSIYDPYAPSGSRFSTQGLKNMTVPRMYHSTAVLLDDGSILTAGSNPNSDVTWSNPAGYTNTEYHVERFYPTWYNQPRPTQPNVSELGYGGGYFEIVLSSQDLGGSLEAIKSAKMTVVRSGFATHGVNFGQRFLELNSTYTVNQDGSVGGTLHVSNMPPNPNIFQPGPAMLFLVVNGIPSKGRHIMVGTGQLGDQKVLEVTPLPESREAPSPSSHSAALAATTNDGWVTFTDSSSNPSLQFDSGPIFVLSVAALSAILIL